MRAYLALSHVASQLIHKHVAVENCSQDSLIEDLPDSFQLPLEAWSLANWLEFIRECYNRNQAFLPWLRPFIERYDPEARFLASAIYEHLQRCVDANAKYILWEDASYPKLLRYIEDPPLGLTLLGSELPLLHPAISVIGSRKVSPFALQQSYLMGQRLAEFNCGVVSGGAYGCDIAVHQGMLASEQPRVMATVVFAGGLSHLYPAGNQQVFAALQARGAALISERLWRQAAKPADFPVRNRIISGLAWELVVMQAGRRSGACITAKKALDQGREVLVLRHNYDDLHSWGSASLIADGAYSFGSVDELLSNYVFMHERHGTTQRHDFLV